MKMEDEFGTPRRWRLLGRRHREFAEKSRNLLDSKCSGDERSRRSSTLFLRRAKNWGNCKEGILVEKKVLILQLDDTFGFSPHGNLYVFLLVVVVFFWFVSFS